MPSPLQRIHIYGVQDRRSFALAKRPWVVRYTIDGRHKSRSFRTRIEGERYRSELLRAVQDGARFDPETGEPESWHRPLSEIRVHEWVRRWLAEQWDEWAPRTRASAAEALARFVSVAVVEQAKPPADLRPYLQRTLGPGSESDQTAELEGWLAKNGLVLGDLDRPRVAEIARLLTLKQDGTPLAATTAARLRTNSHACVLAAVDAGAIPADPWPRRTRGQARRKVSQKRTVDLRSLPDPETMAKAIAAIPTHQPGSRTYWAMTAVAYYAGLRPSEVAMLRVRSLTLPADGWGRIDVTEADVSFDEAGEPKTGPRSVPIPPVLVAILVEWLEEKQLSSPEGLLFRTRNDTRPSASNWRRAWHRALRSIGQEPLRVYDCRHAAATTWLAAGVPLGEVARRMGHSVDTLVTTYVGALQGDEALANRRIDEVLAT